MTSRRISEVLHRKPKPKPEPWTIERFLHEYADPGNNKRISPADTLYADMCRRIMQLEQKDVK